MVSRLSLICGIMLTVLVSGCVSAPDKADLSREAVFFPEPPTPPRIQHLRSFTSSQDIETEASKFDKFVTGEEAIVRRLDKPYGVAVYDGKIYVCDSNYSVMVFDLKDKKFRLLEGAKGLGKLLQPINISIDDEGTKYVSDPVRGQVLVYDKDEFFVKAVGSPIEWVPIDAYPFGENLYVVDKRSNEIWVLNKRTNDVIDKLGKKDEDRKNWLFRPTNITFSKDGTLYVSDAGRFQVVKMDRDGHFLDAIGELGTSPGRFSRPRGLSTDDAGRIYVVDAAFDNVQIFNPDGRLLMAFGRAGKEPGDFFLPAQVAIDKSNVQYFSNFVDPNFQAEALLIVTNQFGPHLVNVFALGKQKGVKYPTDEELLRQLEEVKQKQLKEQEKEKKPENKGQEDENADGGTSDK